MVGQRELGRLPEIMIKQRLEDGGQRARKGEGGWPYGGGWDGGEGGGREGALLGEGEGTWWAQMANQEMGKT